MSQTYEKRIDWRRIYQKCVKKVKVNSKYRRKFYDPKTPYQRVLNCPDVCDERKEALKMCTKS